MKFGRFSSDSVSESAGSSPIHPPSPPPSSQPESPVVSSQPESPVVSSQPESTASSSEMPAHPALSTQENEYLIQLGFTQADFDSIEKQKSLKPAPAKPLFSTKDCEVTVGVNFQCPEDYFQFYPGDRQFTIRIKSLCSLYKKKFYVYYERIHVPRLHYKVPTPAIYYAPKEFQNLKNEVTEQEVKRDFVVPPDYQSFKPGNASLTRSVKLKCTSNGMPFYVRKKKINVRGREKMIADLYFAPKEFINRK